MKKFLALILAMIMAMSLVACGGGGKEYPSKQVNVVCPFGAGGASDTLARLFAAGMEKELGTSFIVENKTGGGGAIGFEAGMNAKADGYTVTYLSFEITTIEALAGSAASPDDFIMLGSVMKIPPVIAVPANSKWNTLDDLLADAKANPGTINVGTAGAGASYHMGLVQLENAAGVKFNVVPHNDGAASAVAALLGGNLDAIAVGTSEALANVKNGDFKLLTVIAPERVSFFPDVPCTYELGYQADICTWGCFGVPKGTPDDVVATLRAAAEKVLNGEEIKTALDERAFVHWYNDGASFQKEAEKQYVDNVQLLKDLGMVD